MSDSLHKTAVSINEIIKNFNEFINRSGAENSREIIQIPAITLLTDMEELIKNNPSLKNMTLNEAAETNELHKIFEILKEKYTSSASVSKDVELLKSIVPKNHIKPVNKLANKMTKNIIDEGEIELLINSKKSKKDVTTKVMLAYDNRHIQLSGREKYTPYDREVYDGVVTLYEAGNEAVTPAMVYRAMNGLTENEKVSPQSIETVRKSLDKSRFIRATIDYTEEAKLYNKKIQKTVYEGYLLAADKITVKISGNEQEGYKLLRKPILYEYAQISGQIITVPAKLLQTKDAVRSTDEVIVIRGYLLRQIEWLKNDKSNRSANITYQGIYEELNVSKATLNEKAYENKTRKIRNHVKAVLDEWYGQGYILKYEEYKESNSIKGVTIISV